jgi:hypothetical protein
MSATYPAKVLRGHFQQSRGRIGGETSPSSTPSQQACMKASTVMVEKSKLVYSIRALIAINKTILQATNTSPLKIQGTMKSITDFLTQVLLKTNPAPHQRAAMKLFLPHTMLFVGSIWKNI